MRRLGEVAGYLTQSVDNPNYLPRSDGQSRFCQINVSNAIFELALMNADAL